MFFESLPGLDEKPSFFSADAVVSGSRVLL